MEVPAGYIKTKAIDYPAEIFSVMGSTLNASGVNIPPLSAGTLSLIELIDSQIWHNPDAASLSNYARFFALVTLREQMIEPVREFVEAGKQDRIDDVIENSPLALDQIALGFLFKHSELFSDPQHFSTVANQLLHQAFTGYEMLPSAGGARVSTGPHLFGAFFLASTAALIIKHTHKNFIDAVWNTPLTLAGHLACVDFLHNDTKGLGISRPKDPADIKLQLKLAKERENDGILHPWQLDRDRAAYYPPTQKQLEANPACLDQWKDFLNSIKGNK